MGNHCIGLIVVQSWGYFGEEAALTACSNDQWENCSNQFFSSTHTETHTHESLLVQTATGSEPCQCVQQIDQQQPASLFNINSIIPTQPAGTTNVFMYGDSFNQLAQGSPSPHHQPSADISDCISSCLAMQMQPPIQPRPRADPSNDPQWVYNVFIVLYPNTHGPNEFSNGVI